MSSVSSIRLPGLATGMDTESMVKEMLTGEQNKIDKVKQKEETIKWQQEIYREVISDVKGLNDKYFSLSSKNSIINSNAWNTLSIKSSNENVITATGTAGASNVEYSFDVEKLAQPAKISIKIDDKTKKLSELDPSFTKKTFKVDLGDEGKSKTITLESDDTVDSMIKKINESMSGEIKASYSEMTGEFTIETKNTGNKASLNFIDITVNVDESETEGISNNVANGSNSKIIVTPQGGVPITLEQENNLFTIDGIKYEVHSVGISKITSKQDVKPVVENMKAFVEDYNKIMDKMYDLVTQKTNRDYPPLTEAQRKNMSEEEIERWEKKAKQGLLRNDSEMRRFIDDMHESIFGEKMEILNAMGLTTHDDYNKKGQISLDENKFIKSLESNSEKVYEVFAKSSNSVLENMKSTINKYVGGSSSIFARKAGLEKTASVANNFYSEQLKRQEEAIKKLQRKMDEKEEQLYKKFGALEASMNKLNSQMNYFMQM